MALYVWKCESCGYITRHLLPARPKLDRCEKDICKGELKFVTTTSQSTKEVIDNGLMRKPVERAPGIEAQLKERNELAEDAHEDKIV